MLKITKTYIRAILIVLVLLFSAGEVGKIYIHQTVMVKEKKIKKSKFMIDLAKVESSGNPKARLGQYLGLYQIGDIAFKDIGFDIQKFGRENYLNNEYIQDSVFIVLLKKNRKYLYQYIKAYSGTTICDIKITESGILAGANMGIGFVMEFLESDGEYDMTDGNGVPVSKYIKQFSGYDMSFLKKQ